jgi:membrane-associated protein
MTEDNTTPDRSDKTTGGRDWRRFLTFRWMLTWALLVVVGLWLASTIGAYAAQIDFEGLGHPYGVLFGFVVFDALVPIFPSESLLNTASTLVAQGSSELEIWRLIVAGALGAIVGDSMLYWLSRTVLRKFMAGRVDQAEQNEKVARSLRLFGEQASMLIVFGRFVPGLRFVVGATMGLTRYSYSRFLLWDSIGSVSWAAFSCVSSYLVGSVIDDRPVVSMLVSLVITTALLAALYRRFKRDWQEQAASSTEPARPRSGLEDS